MCLLSVVSTLTDMDFASLQAQMLVFSPATQLDLQCVDISISDDGILELTETFNVQLTSSQERVDAGSPATVSIMDNDG